MDEPDQVTAAYPISGCAAVSVAGGFASVHDLEPAVLAAIRAAGRQPGTLGGKPSPNSTSNPTCLDLPSQLTVDQYFVTADTARKVFVRVAF